ncbi:MAG: isoprenylcysteine carboxylmethyltransferase family protein, partial [Bryobacteraceae bacterium]
MVAAGLVVAGRSAWLGLVFAAAFLLIYLPVIELEEQHLRNLFPEYANYARNVPALWPHFRTAPAPGIRPARWNAQIYWKNREYQALFGFLASSAWLFWLVTRR